MLHSSTTNPLTEGGVALFEYQSSRPAPVNGLEVDILVTQSNSVVTEDADFLRNDPPDTVTFPPGANSVALTLGTAADLVDEPHGTLTASVVGGQGYTVSGTHWTAAVTVEDDDKPPTPAGLRANGHLINNSVALRWSSVPRAKHYEIRYAVENCEEMDGVADCSPGSFSEIKKTTGPVIATNIADLTSGTLYRVEVRMVNLEDEHSKDWSTVFVFPTSSPMSRLLNTVEIATAPFHGFIRKKVGTKSHDFRYTICEDSIPMGLTNDLEEIKQAIKKWEDTVVWNTGQGNIITTTHYALGDDEECSDREIPLISRRIQVRFVDEMFMGDTLCGIVSACWRSYSWSTPGVGTINTGNVFINKEYDTGITYWNTLVAGGDCTRLEELLVHEVGHGFGIGSYELSFDPDDYNKHPINKKLAIMSYANSRKYCEPQAYDIVAIMGSTSLGEGDSDVHEADSSSHGAGHCSRLHHRRPAVVSRGGRNPRRRDARCFDADACRSHASAVAWCGAALYPSPR